MSLQLVANHLAQKGRGPDSTLVHMSNREVAGLQALAQKHGGQLSVNPDTGLPEAGFLDNILPAVAGAGLAYFGVNPMMAAGIVGGISALDSKDLSKGLVAGLGAYGGAGMVGGLAGLGAAGADTAAMAVPEYQAAVGTGAGQFVNEPMQSLRTLGGGSALTGSLPILAGLAPAAVEAIDAEEDDEAPEQHKGYIRKYAFDPVTGQYKQVGAYEAGGDPNVDVSAKAGTAGSYGGVGQSEYEAAQGMAAGGTTDSSRIYDYLMGRGPNPMQFTRATAPTATVAPTPPVAPITPTTPILEPVYDPYGNRVNEGGNFDPERREAELNARNDYLSVNGNDMTLNKYFDLSPKDRADLDARAAEASPIRAGIGKFVTTLGTPMIFRGVQAISNMFKGLPLPETTSDELGAMQNLEAQTIRDPLGNLIAYKSLPDQFAGYQPNTPFVGGVPTPTISTAPEGTVGSPTPQGDPQQQKEAAMQRAVAESNAAANRTYGGNANNNGPTGRDAVSGDGNDKGQYGAVAAGYTGGSEAADGGLSTPYGFQHMAHGGIANLHQYNLGSYSDGGRLLKGPGDGVSDDIPATIGHGQPARLADGEFVIPARIVSEIGNGSTDAGARELYKMMDRIQAGRKKTVGKDQVARNTKAVRHLPA